MQDSETESTSSSKKGEVFKPAAKVPKILVLFYSTRGHVKDLADAIYQGLKDSECVCDLKRIPETLQKSFFEDYGLPHVDFLEIPEATHKNLIEYDGILLGMPVWYGSLPTPVMNFLQHPDVEEFSRQGKFQGKFASCFANSAEQHQGLEMALFQLLHTFIYMGFIACGVPLISEFPKIGTQTDVAIGTSMFGSGALTGHNFRFPNDDEKLVAKRQGQMLLRLVTKYLNSKF